MAKLRGIKPTLIEKRLKCLFYGRAGVGKTTAAIQFPRPYLIDTEKGAENDQYVQMLNKSGGSYFFTNDPMELVAEVTALLSEKHEYRTLIIDPLTVIYSSLCDKYALEVGTDFGKNKIPADRIIKHLISLLTRLDMNVILTSHAKSKWERGKDAKGQDTVIDAGMTFDCYPKLDYLFDLVFEIEKRGEKRVGIVRKTRIPAFADGEQFPFGYDAIADKYGRAILEREAVAEPLATPEQIAEVRELLSDRTNAADLTAKWFDKAGAENWSEMPASAMEKCIQFLKTPSTKGVLV